MLAFTIVASLVTGCRSWVFPATSRVAPELVADLRGTGRVLAATTTEWSWDGTTDVTDVLVLDVGGSSSRDALDRALGTLRARGWKAEGSPDLWRTRLESDKWDDAYLTVEPLTNYEATKSERLDEKLDTNNEALLKRLTEQNTRGQLVVLEARALPDN
ncbi:hypothetical protein [Nonomuraea fuscirosea]|uniref:hypothetical protein n=1 Tax=Nonomuraea fuscirosea TaxID=1291556 RepID=UPI003431D1EA